MVEMNVAELVREAVLSADAKTKDNPDRSAQKLHRARSSAFVGALGEGFQNYYAADSRVKVLWQGNRELRKEFGMNELLFDLTVCESTTVPSPRLGTPLTVVANGLWSVESEFARDARQSVFDFNKLVLSSAENKLFIAPVVDDGLVEKLLKTLGAVADNCSGNVFLALVPHPRTWDNGRQEIPMSWKRYERKWELLD